MRGGVCRCGDRTGRRPAPVVDHHLHRHEGFRGRVGIDAIFIDIGFNALAIDRGGRVLAGDRPVVNAAVAAGTQRLQDLQLFVADVFSLEHRRRLHSHEAEQLQHMVLQHVLRSAPALS